MSKMRNIQGEKKAFNDSAEIARTLLNLSLSNISFSSSQISKIEIILKMLEEMIILRENVPEGEDKFVCFSDGGFVWKFNCNDESGIAIGKYGKLLNKKSYSLSQICKNPELILRNPEKLVNLRFFMKNHRNNETQEISIKDRLKKTEKKDLVFQEFILKDVITNYNRLFVKFAVFQAILNENHFRSKIMNGALENCTAICKKLTFKVNRLRQEIITSEMSIISTIVGVVND